MIDLLVTAPMPPAILDRLEARFAVHRLWQAADRAAMLRDIGPRIRGMATSALGGFIGSAVIDALPALEIIANFGVGYDNIDVEAALAHRIMVTNSPQVLTEETADLTLGLLLATLRQIPQAERHLREGRWPQGAFPLSPSLRGRRVGILGLGDIGKAVARRLEGFAIEIAYCGRQRQDSVPYAYYPTPLALAQAVDTLVILTPGGAATRHLVGADVLAALGPQGVVINVARGSVMDTQALIAALQSGALLAAGLDVYDDEPNVPPALLDLPQVVCLPHIGSASVLTRLAMGGLMADNLESWFDKGVPVTPIAEAR